MADGCCSKKFERRRHVPMLPEEAERGKACWTLVGPLAGEEGGWHGRQPLRLLAPRVCAVPVKLTTQAARSALHCLDGFCISRPGQDDSDCSHGRRVRGLTFELTGTRQLAGTGRE